MLKIYGLPISTWSNRVRFTANKLDLDYDFIPVNLAAGEGQTEAYLALHPAGKVPAMDDAGFKLFESGAICKYLAAKTASDLYPSDFHTRAIVDQWSDFVALHVAKAMERVLFNEVIYQFVGVEKDQRSLEEGRTFLARFLPIIDTQLGKSSFLARDSLSLADMVLLAWLDPAEAAKVDLSPYHNIVVWRSSLMQESFYSRCHGNYLQALQAMS